MSKCTLPGDACDHAGGCDTCCHSKPDRRKVIRDLVECLEFVRDAYYVMFDATTRVTIDTEIEKAKEAI